MYFPVVLLTTLHKVVLTFEYVDQILKGHHSHESFCAVISSAAVYFAEYCRMCSISYLTVVTFLIHWFHFKPPHSVKSERFFVQVSNS